MKYVFDQGELRPWPEVARRRRERAARSPLPAPYVVSDHLDDVQNPADGKVYNSKSAYYHSVKASGCEIVGNEAEKLMAAPAARPDVKSGEIGAALHKVKQGYKPELGAPDQELEKIAHG
jgi:hypothetical protein